MKPPSNPHLPATLEMIQVFEAVRNEHHEIIDFISVVTNQGERLSESNSVFVAEGIFDAFKQVVETGIPSKTERHYIHEQFDGWFILSIVKLNDGVVAATIDITKEKQYKPEINELRESNKERLRTIKEVYQSILSRERLEDSLVLLTELVTRETSGGARVIYHINNEDGTGDSKDIGGLPDHETPRAGDLSIPIKSREDKLLGTVTMYFREGHDATDEELVLADIVATTAAAILTSHTDNVKRAEAERLLKEANSQLRQMDEAKTNFFNNVSHEFRTPLTLLIGPLEDVLRNVRSKVPPDDLRKLEISYRSSIRLHKLVNTLLDFARIEAGKLEVFYQPTDFSQVTIDLASNFRSAIERGGLKYVVKVEPVNESIYLNRDMWEKIVSNLLSNAFKFTQKGKIEVITRNKKKTVELRVKDTGIGIATKNINRIFERFTRIEAAHARTFEGTGIGLALVRELVSINGGTIKVKSEENVGSEFIVSIPKGKDHLPKKRIFESRDDLSAAASTKPFIEEVSGWQPEDGRQMRRKLKKYKREGALRILIAEDNADMREYLAGILSLDKYEILAMEDGQKVLTFLRQGGSADLILADVMMPEVDGYELVQWLKSDPRFQHIPIILLSARTDEEARIEGLTLGADDYVIKPFSSKELRALVRTRISRSGPPAS